MDTLRRRYAVRHRRDFGADRILLQTGGIRLYGLRQAFQTYRNKVLFLPAHAQHAQTCLSALRLKELSYGNLFRRRLIKRIRARALKARARIFCPIYRQNGYKVV